MSQETKDFAFLHFIVMVWGFTAILGMLISLPPVEMVFFRTLLASMGLLVIVLFGKQKFLFRQKIDYFYTLGTGALIAVHWILFFLSARVSNVSVCLAGMATCSMWTSILEPLIHRKKVKVFEVLLSLLAIVGIVIIFQVEIDYFLGIFFAILSAMIAAIFTVINSRLTQRHNSFVITFYEMTGAVIAIVLFFPFYLDLEGVETLKLSPSLSDWFYLLVLSLVCTVFAFSFSIKLMQRLSAFSVNLTVNLEPVYGIILALIFFPENEVMEPGFYLGTAVILLSVLLYPILNRRSKRKALDTDLLR